MGLGGIARDSIVGLNKLVHDDDEDPVNSRRHSVDDGGLAGSWNNGSKKGSDEFLYLESDDPLQMAESSQGSFETSLNDGLSTRGAASSSTTPRSSAAVAAATSYNNVSATNSRSLDSYRSANESPSSSQPGQYQGFNYEGYTDYYSEDFGSYYDDYSAASIGKGGDDKNIFCCFFAPWMQQQSIEPEDESGQDQSHTGDGQESGVTSTTSTAATPKDPHEGTESSDHPKSAPASTPKVNFAEPPPAKKPSTPHLLSGGLDDSVTTNASTSPETDFHDEKKQEDIDLSRKVDSETNEKDKSPARIRGILKVRRCSSLTDRPVSNKGDKKDEPSSSPNKRHLFPTYEPKKSHAVAGEGEAKSINFNPMARVLTIPSRKDIPLHQKAQVWWQRCDYDEFKKTGRIISKAMECGGSEIWLASSNAWGSKSSRSRKINGSSDSSERSQSHSEEYNKALSKYVPAERKGSDDEGDDSGGNKWWCKFGHSRRGLEHIASSSEGKARQQSVLMAIRMVLEEQRRQRASRTKDPNKLRNVGMQYTSWARDLALAAGAADAEAVASNFDPTAACRAQHFAKRLNVNSNSLHKLEHIEVGGGVAKAVTSQILDANTHAAPRRKSKTLRDAHVEHDRSEDSLSRRAKGFIPGGGDDVSAAAVLSGMGTMGIRQSTVKA